MWKCTESTGFTPPLTRRLGRERRTVALAELVASMGLAVATVIVATAVTVGIARADAATNVIDQESSLFAIALLLGLAFIAIGGLAVLPDIHLPHLPRKTRRG
jgi:heme/copper-type cytochrome/quinol oxidase subunit 3